MPMLISEQNLGYLLKDARKKRNLTQSEMGRLVGLEQAVISRIEQGRHALRVDTLFKLLSALNYEILLQPREESVRQKEGDSW